MSIDLTTLRGVFFDEATELLDSFETCLLQLESTPEDPELLNSIFRCAHSIKGGAATFGFPDLARFTHSLETLLDEVRNSRVPVTKELCGLLLESLDCMRSLLTAARDDSGEQIDFDDLVGRLDLACKSDAGAGESDEDWGLLAEPQIFEITFSAQPGVDPLPFLKGLPELGDVLRLECDTSGLPALGELDPSVCYLSWSAMIHTSVARKVLEDYFAPVADPESFRLFLLGGEEEEVEVAVEPAKAAVAAPVAGASNGAVAKDTGTIRVSAEKLDRLINLVGELVINQSILNAVTTDFEMERLPQLLEAVAQMERSSRELQERVMSMRLLPIKVAFGRFPRLVHDLSSAVGKKIELKLAGEETELDKNLIEALGDPLTHLVRNSIDHGLETPEDRLDRGKSETGTLTISAVHEGGNILVEVSDDGKGLSVEKIRAKALERGLISADEDLTEEQVYNLIFLPGFSTAEAVTDLSGRGVGMDIVRQKINSIGGSVKVSSIPGKGTTTRIRLPLTMAILEGQSIKVGDGVFIVPLTSILESLRPKQQDVHHVAQLGEVVSVRGEYLPVLRLHQEFRIEPKAAEPWTGSLVLVESEGKRVALMADELLGQGQIVIKSLESNYRKVDGIAGATILGDGRVALILDVPGLIRGIEETSSSRVAAA